MTCTWLQRGNFVKFPNNKQPNNNLYGAVYAVYLIVVWPCFEADIAITCVPHAFRLSTILSVAYVAQLLSYIRHKCCIILLGRVWKFTVIFMLNLTLISHNGLLVVSLKHKHTFSMDKFLKWKNKTKRINLTCLHFIKTERDFCPMFSIKQMAPISKGCFIQFYRYIIIIQIHLNFSGFQWHIPRNESVQWVWFFGWNIF